jgi:transcription elongation factor Elf1
MNGFGMDWLEVKYLNLVSNRLRNYKRKSTNLFNFSCCFCGDSEVDSRKSRGYIYNRKGKTLYHCHNCNITYGFDKFLKELDFQVYSDYLVDKLKETGQKKTDLQDFVNKMKKPVFLKDGPLKGLKKISQLDPNHPCKVFVESRKIPTVAHSKLFYCPKFFTWVNGVMPGKFGDGAIARDEGRLLIPFIDKNQNMHAFQGRSLDPDSKTRYITIVNDESVPKIYGLDTVDFNKRVYVTEGPIDSLFLPNAIATAGGDLVSTVKDLPKKNLVIVYDNESRSIETKKKLEKAIINGYTVCIWPENMEAKDINDMILSGISADFVRYIIDTHSYSDLRAKLELTKWSKV